jgi:hypothetical protein
MAAPHGVGFWAGHALPAHVTGGIACAFGITPAHDGAAPHAVPAGTAAWQTPKRHVSRVQGFPSLPHPTPSARFECVHPEPVSQLSAVHGLLSLQFGAAPPTQVPLWHASPVVQALPSVHELPVSGFAEHPPGSPHTPAWHWSADAVQSSALPPLQRPE